MENVFSVLYIYCYSLVDNGTDNKFPYFLDKHHTFKPGFRNNLYFAMPSLKFSLGYLLVSRNTHISIIFHGTFQSIFDYTFIRMIFINPNFYLILN